jgi:kynurenine formamidase
MQIAFMNRGMGWMADLSRPIDISLPVRFAGQRLKAFGASPASAAPYKAGDFVGSVAQGGSCNCDVVSFSPHLHGTHTECIGHIIGKPLHIADILQDSFMLAKLVSVAPADAATCGETCGPAMREGDTVITRAGLEGKIPAECSALALRTLPNDDGKKIRDYDAAGGWAYFTQEAMRYIAECDVKHLLVDTPSVDRGDDAGHLATHHIFWEDNTRTITEFIYVPNYIEDGMYLLNLQIGAVASDAVPSRPLLFRLEEE